jgi:hypothetical protein
MPYDEQRTRSAAAELAEQLVAGLDEGLEVSGLMLVARTEPGGIPLIAYEVDAEPEAAPALVLDTLVSAARAASLRADSIRGGGRAAQRARQAGLRGDRRALELTQPRVHRRAARVGLRAIEVVALAPVARLGSEAVKFQLVVALAGHRRARTTG